MENWKKFVCVGVVVFVAISLMVCGCDGTSSKKGITIPKVYKNDKIVRVAVLSFGNDNFTDKIIENLVINSKWQVIDRAHLDRILKEQDLQQTEQFDKETAVEIGKLSGVDLVVFGEYRGASSMAIVKAIDVTTAEYLAYQVTDLSKCDEEDVQCQANLTTTALLPNKVRGKTTVEFNPKKK